VANSSTNNVSTFTELTAPGTPTIQSAVAGDGSATVTVASGSGGAPTTYTVTSSPGGKTCTVTLPATSCVVTGLTNGVSYTFTATAANAAGSSGASGASSAIRPSTAGDGSGVSGSTATLPPVAGKGRCKKMRCSTKGKVPTGATVITQTATLATKTVAGKCKINKPKKKGNKKGKGKAKAYTCKIKLKKGTWIITTEAKKGGVVIARTVKTTKVK